MHTAIAQHEPNKNQISLAETKPINQQINCKKHISTAEIFMRDTFNGIVFKTVMVWHL